jgi:hypothetical protein
MQKKCPPTQVKDKRQIDIDNFLTFYCNMNTQDKPLHQVDQAALTNIEIKADFHLNLKIPQPIVKNGRQVLKREIFKVSVAIVSPFLLGIVSPFLSGAHSPSDRDLPQAGVQCVQPPAEELQIHEIPK